MTQTSRTDTPTETPDQPHDSTWWTRLRSTLADINSRENYGTKLYP
jgi:hypothetical protein